MSPERPVASPIAHPHGASSAGEDHDASDAVVALDIVAESSRYWRSIFGSVGVSVLLYVGSLGLIRLTLLPVPVSWNLGISGGAGLSALGALATIVVALQVAVRNTSPMAPPATELARSVARQRGLEAFARFCGVAAIAVAVSVVLGYWPRFGESVNVPAIVGASAGALLIAGLAADASIVTGDRWDGSVSNASRSALIEQYSMGLARLDATSAPQRLGVGVLGSIGFILAVPVVVALTVMLAGGSPALIGMASGAAGSVAVVSYLSILVIRFGIVSRQHLMTALGSAYLGLVIVVALVAVWAVKQDVKAPWWVKAALFVVLVWGPVLGALIAATRVGDHRGPAAGIVGHLIQARLTHLTRETEQGGDPEVGWSLGSIWISLVLPFVVYPIALIRLSRVRCALYGSARPEYACPSAPLDPLIAVRKRRIESRWKYAAMTSIASALVQLVVASTVVVVGMRVWP